MYLQELAKNPNWRRSARARIKEVLEGPDAELDRIIDGILHSNSLAIPAELLADFPILQDRQVAAGVINAVSSKRIDQRFVW